MDDNINLDYYKIFSEVAKQGNITKAANSLHISQPAITQTINKLEEQFNTKLFIRLSRGVQLTDMGKNILEEVNLGLKHFSNVSSKCKYNQDLMLGSLKIGSGTSIAKWLLSGPLVKFNRLYPQINLSISDKKTDLLLQDLIFGNLDFAIIQKPNVVPAALTYSSLKNAELVFIVGKEYAKKIPANFKFNDLTKYNIIVQQQETANRTYFDDLCQKNNTVIEPKIEVSGYNIIVDFVKHNMGIGFIPKYIALPEIENGEVSIINTDSPATIIEYGIVYNKNYVSIQLKKFLELFI